jgi:hypothetical protein
VKVARKPAKPKATKGPAKSPASDVSVQTSINLPRDLFVALRMAAVARADQLGGRPSVSAIVVEILQRHRGEIIQEAKTVTGILPRK